jgi:two-component system OmpR family sensor kinase
VNRWLDGLSIRWRITAGTLVVAVVVAGVAGLLLRFEVATIIRNSTVQLLHTDTAPLEARIKATPTDPDIRAGEGQLVAIVEPSGTVVTSNLPDRLSDRVATLLRLRGGDPTQEGTDGAGYLVLTERVNTTHGQWRIVVARSLAPGQLVLNSLGLTFVIGALVLVATFGVTSWLLSGLSLRPVSRMRLEAERLGGEASQGSLPVGPARDELAALATTLNEFLDRTRASVDRERQMIADASHELRTPLAVLMAQLDEAVRSARDDGPEKKLIQNVSVTARRLTTLTTNLLELSKLDAGQSTASASWDELVRELSESTDRARMLGQARSVPVDFEIGTADGDERYPVGAASFGRLVDNLFANAISASDAGATVQARLARDASGIVLEVADNGVGMPEDFIDIAFDRFTRPDAARPATAGGSGLGLAIVAAIVASAHGSVSIENRYPGVCVTARFPAVSA